MKKILFSLVALVCSMSMNAQIMKVMKGNTVVATYKASQADNVVFEEAPVLGKTGTEKRTGDIDVNWVQLWENGPRFAEYNVGVTDGKAESYGGYYGWGMSIDKDPNAENKSGNDALTGKDDTATNLWGSKWRMPTYAEFKALQDNCVAEEATVNGVDGLKFTGKGNYAICSVFFPSAGYCNYGTVHDEGGRGRYWSSTPWDSSNSSAYARYLSFSTRTNPAAGEGRFYGYSVRAVLAE